MSGTVVLQVYGFPVREVPNHPPAPVEPKVEDDLFDRTADYFNPGDGPWDFFRACENVGAWGAELPFGEPTQNILSRVRGGADLFGTAMSIPKFFKNLSTLRRNVVEWLHARQLTGAGAQAKVAAAFKKVFYEFFNTINTTTQAALCLNNAKIFPLNGRVPFVNGANQVTTIITDGMSLHDEIRSRHEGDKTIKMFKIAKYTSSVVIAAIVLLGIFYAALLQEIAFVVLILSSVYVVSSILSEVLNKTVKSLPVRV